MEIVRLYTGADGMSHFEDLSIELADFGERGWASELVPCTAVRFREVGGDYDLGFHCAPRRQFVLNLTGSVEIEVGSGESRVFGPGSVFLAEDTTGQGHISRNVDGEPRTCVFVQLP
jgi:hypothetical protein